MYIKKWISIFLLLSAMQVSVHGQAKYEDLKAALILQFAKNIVWLEEKSFDEYRVGFYGSDSAVFNVFKNSQNERKIQGKPLTVHRVTSLDKISGLQILYVDQSHSLDLTEVVNSIKSRHTLLITEQSPDLKNVMLNILYLKEENSISYEINRTNILLEGMQVNPELVLLRGSEIDVREVYNKIKVELASKEQEIEHQKEVFRIHIDQLKKQEQKNKLQKHQIAIDEVRIKALISNTKKLKLEISVRESELDSLIHSVTAQETELSNQKGEIGVNLRSMAAYEQKLEQQKKLIEERSKILENLIKEGGEQKKIIDEQGQTLNVKEQVISLQSKMIYLFLVFLLVAVSLSAIAYRQYRKKHKALNALEETNQNLHEQHEYNLHLNGELQTVNDRLEERVKNRTEILESKNVQLTEYAFVNSHLLRAPLSRILGISNIMVGENISSSNKELVLAMQDSANELDGIVRKINNLLDTEGAVNRREVEKLIKRKIILEQLSEKPSDS